MIFQNLREKSERTNFELISSFFAGSKETKKIEIEIERVFQICLKVLFH